MSVLLETSVGDIVIDLFTEQCPQTSLNFLKLCKIKYYNFCAFHNIQRDFIAQTGDPTATGKGGESVFGVIHGPSRKYFPAEINPTLKHRARGTVSMAVAQDEDSSGGGGGVSGSQFFITLGENLDYLDGKYTVFGEVAEGLETLDKINATLCDDDGRPFRDLRIKHTVILDDPFPDPPGLVIPDASPLPTKEMLETVRLAEDEELEEEGIPEEELEKRRREREAKAQALTLEMVGDLPFAEVKPPENVLFVCKLNPVTREEDLELIFSRFGKIDSCEIIRDKKTGDSLCYGFIEFDRREDCEEAVLRMHNVLIDDRRIHVDFSQSVSKLHKHWVTSKIKKSRGNGESFGGENLRKKTRYRDEDDDDRAYELVFDHGGSLEKEKRGITDERIGETRESEPRERRREGDEDKYRYEGRRGEERQRREERNYDRRHNGERRYDDRRSRSPHRRHGDRDRDRDRDRGREPYSRSRRSRSRSRERDYRRSRR
ncbi:uncharacterized protein VTP21DRAFT_10337 [Calcarisporiella thermophila]|uniref:uncharacterized protein n=1 Tax=Calcarisporiella thermophila TaxID=911321 RepID=UPI003743EB40